MALFEIAVGWKQSQMVLSRGLVPMNQFIHAWNASLKEWSISTGVHLE